MDLSEKIGIAFRKRRNDLQLSQSDLAGIAQTDRSFISDIENGKKNISVNTFAKLCDALDTKPSEILLNTEKYS